MLKILLACATLFESKRLVFVNELIRRSFGPVLILFLRVFCGGKWVLRHSATARGQYNIFFSDYDVALLISESWSDEQLETTLVKFKKIKVILIMLGEVEVYFQSEWFEKKALIFNHGLVVQQVRDIRKLKWMIDRYRETKVPYHRAKAIRSIKSCRQKIRSRNLELRKITNIVFEGCPIPFNSFYSEFFQRNVHFDEKKTNHLLMAMTTVDRSPYLPWSPMILSARDPAIRFEFLEHRAYLREKLCKINPQSNWLDQLQHELSQISEKIKSDPTWITRYRLHLKNEWVEMHSYKNVDLQESNLRETYCLESDLTFQAWMKINLPKISIKTVSLSEENSQATDSKENLAQRKTIDQKTISYVGPLSDRFGFDIFLQFVVFLQESGFRDCKIEICANCNARDLIEANKGYHSELVKLKYQINFVKAPTGTIFFFNRQEYPLEQNWKNYYSTNNFCILGSKEFTKLKKELESLYVADSAQDLT